MTVRIPDAVRLTGISRSTLYVLIRDQRIETVKVGRSRYIVVASLQRFIDANRM
ncbi:helix-turn-helix domain-containing protein [Sphingobium indicum]|uniref:helix-turn-helix domain-containing protein n=1 Tax=Sphingobium indicum TaxID=332055 RepID=UPI0009DAA0CC|nr:helix-turn-helix domain-containing protein [Sphingobium indicum]